QVHAVLAGDLGGHGLLAPGVVGKAAALEVHDRGEVVGRGDAQSHPLTRFGGPGCTTSGERRYSGSAPARVRPAAMARAPTRARADAESSAVSATGSAPRLMSRVGSVRFGMPSASVPSNSLTAISRRRASVMTVIGPEASSAIA